MYVAERLRNFTYSRVRSQSAADHLHTRDEA